MKVQAKVMSHLQGLDARLICVPCQSGIVYLMVVGKGMEAAELVQEEKPNTLIQRIASSECWKEGFASHTPQREKNATLWGEVWSADFLVSMLTSLGVLPLLANDAVLEIECTPALHLRLADGAGAWHGLHVYPSPKKEEHILQSRRRQPVTYPNMLWWLWYHYCLITLESKP